MRGSRNFRQVGGGGGGGQGQSDKKSSDNVFFFFFFFLSSAYSTEVKWLISKKTIIFRGSRGVQLFPGGGGGSNCFVPPSGSALV